MVSAGATAIQQHRDEETYHQPRRDAEDSKLEGVFQGGQEQFAPSHLSKIFQANPVGGFAEDAVVGEGEI